MVSNRIYFEAADAFESLVFRVQPDAWEKPGLGVWDVRSLAGHASRSLVTVITYLDKPAETEVIASPEEYFRWSKTAQITNQDAVALRGRDAGAALGDAPAEFVANLVGEVKRKLGAVKGDPVIETIGGGMRVSEYLRTRTFDLAVHSLDIARALGLTFSLPKDVLDDAMALAARIAARSDKSSEVLLALTGRSALPSAYSVV